MKATDDYRPSTISIPSQNINNTFIVLLVIRLIEHYRIYNQTSNPPLIQ